MDAHDRWRRTFEDEQQRLWHSLWAFSGDSDLAADAVAEAFAQGVRRGDAVLDPAAWVWRAGFRICAGLLSARRGGAGVDPDVLRLRRVPGRRRPTRSSSSWTPSGASSDADRRLVALGLIGGLDSSTIGEVLGISAGAARVRLHRTRGRLRDLLDPSDHPARPSSRDPRGRPTLRRCVVPDVVDRSTQALRRHPSPVAWEDVLARLAEPEVDLEPAVAAARRPGEGRRRSRWTPVAIVGVAAAIVALAAVLWSDDRDDQVHTDGGATTHQTTTPETSTSATSPTTGPAGRTGDVRSFPVTGSTGSTYVVWGGEDGEEVDRLDGFTVDVASGAVTPIPEAPMEPAYRTSGVWTGEELIAWTGDPAAMDGDAPAMAAIWHPERGWRAIAAPPAEVASGNLAAVWTGTRAVAATGSGATVAYDPGTDRWEDVPTCRGATPWSPTLVWTGTEVVAWVPGGYAGPYPAERGSPIADRGWRWTPGATRWVPLPDLPNGHRTQTASLVWTGEELLVWGLSTGGDVEGGVGVGARLATGRPGVAAAPALAADRGGLVRGHPGLPVRRRLARRGGGGGQAARPRRPDGPARLRHQHRAVDHHGADPPGLRPDRHPRRAHDPPAVPLGAGPR